MLLRRNVRPLFRHTLLELLLQFSNYESLIIIKRNGFSQSIAKQRLDIHPATEYATGNNYVKTDKPQQERERLFLWSPRRAKAWR
jgi:hypothetical protein